MSQVSEKRCDLDFQGVLFSCHGLHPFFLIPVITIKMGSLQSPFFTLKIILFSALFLR